MYDQDEIIIENLRNERLEAIRVEKEKRSIEPKSEASFANRNVLQQEGFKPEQTFYDPKAKRRMY